MVYLWGLYSTICDEELNNTDNHQIPDAKCWLSYGQGTVGVNGLPCSVVEIECQYIMWMQLRSCLTLPGLDTDTNHKLIR